MAHAAISDAGRGAAAGFDLTAAPLSVWRVAGLLDAPGCARRMAVDSAGAPIEALADLLGHPPGRQSPFAHARTRMFAARCTAAGLAPLVALARERFGVPVAGVRELTVTGAPQQRAVATRRQLSAAVGGDAAATLTLLRQPVFELEIGGRRRLLAADTLICVGGDRLRLIEPRTFACVDGVADPGRLAQAARQIAVLVAAVEALGVPVDTGALLVMPKNFGLTPTGALLDVAPQVRRLRRVLAAVPAAPLPELPAAVPADPASRAAAGNRVATALQALPSRFGDGCLGCALFGYCRAERSAADAVERVGTDAANLCGQVGTVADALALAHGDRRPAGAGQAAVADGLARAARALALAG